MPNSNIQFDHVQDVQIAYKKERGFVNVYLISTFKDKEGNVRDYTMQIRPAFEKTFKTKKPTINALLAMAGYKRGE